MSQRDSVPRPPGPGGVDVLRSAPRAARDPAGLMVGLARTYGDLVFLKAGPFDVYIANHPDLAQDVLETNDQKFVKGSGSEDAKRLMGEGLLVSEDPLHAEQRRRMDAHFTPEAVTAYGDTVARQARRLSDHWRPDHAVDAFDHMLWTTSNVIMRSLTGHLEDADAARIAKALADNAASFWRLFLPFSETIERLPLRGSQRFVQARRTVDEFLYATITRFRGGGGLPDSLLARLLEAVDPQRGDGMPDRQARDESVNLFLAARATTATGLTWTWYLLSQHPEAEARLHEEVDALGDDPTAADLPRLRYTRAAFAEALRVYPPAWILKRQSTEDHELGGYPVPEGSTVITSQYVIHHDERWWPDPERYDPERFLSDANDGRPEFAYFPFGGGNRKCIGDHFAWMEAPLILATLARRWRLRLLPGHPVALSPKVTLKPKYGMRMILESRASA